MTETNRKIAELLHAIADSLEARRENAYRTRAYRRGADALLQLGEDVSEIARRGELMDIPGIGKELSSKVGEFLRTGTMAAYEAVKRPLPTDVADWSTLPGLTEAAVQHLYYRLGIRSLSDLDALARSHLLRTLPGLSISEDELLAAIQARLTGPERPASSTRLRSAEDP
jgi:DNA polymerase (family 10)